jgi:hypothetical protein
MSVSLCWYTVIHGQQNIKFYENLFCGSWVVHCWQSDTHHERNGGFAKFVDSVYKRKERKYKGGADIHIAMLRVMTPSGLFVMTPSGLFVMTPSGLFVMTPSGLFVG